MIYKEEEAHLSSLWEGQCHPSAIQMVLHSDRAFVVVLWKHSAHTQGIQGQSSV